MGAVYGHLMSCLRPPIHLCSSPWQALLFVIKDHPREVSIVTSEDAQSALYALLTTRYGISQQVGSSPSGSVGSSAGATPVSSQGNSSTAIATSASSAALTNGGGFQVNRRLW